MNDTKISWLALGASIAAVAIALVVGGNNNQPLSVDVKYPDLFGAAGTRMPNGMTIGAEGTDTVDIVAGSCALIVGSVTMTASTTKAYDCAVSGADPNDIVIAVPATSTAYAANDLSGFEIVGAKASTTAGFLTFLVFNGSGGDTNPSIKGFSSSTNYILFDITR